MKKFNIVKMHSLCRYLYGFSTSLFIISAKVECLQADSKILKGKGLIIASITSRKKNNTGRIVGLGI